VTLVNAAETRKLMQSVLRGLTAPQVEQLIQASVAQKVPAGQALINEGERVSGLMVLLQGKVEILKHGPDGLRQPLANLEAPTLVGEMSVITDRPASATAIALADCEFQLLTRAQFQRLIAADNIAAYRLVVIIAGVLAERLAKLDRKVLELTGHWNL